MTGDKRIPTVTWKCRRGWHEGRTHDEKKALRDQPAVNGPDGKEADAREEKAWRRREAEPIKDDVENPGEN